MKHKVKVTLGSWVEALISSDMRISDRDLIDLVEIAIVNADSVETLETYKEMIDKAIAYEKAQV